MEQDKQRLLLHIIQELMEQDKQRLLLYINTGTNGTR